ncbi:histidine kinase [Streptomyces sp. 1114.5]|uniref:sensor histidine kinase n=1 Tax=Streptomyces sp. 1114.5 TaxID=1938830 RepID=UPI000F26EA94|nr:histidine kinase [Streptomyces sp. 1114.5]RKT12237.1 histidine kinase [Streptomyces sp. 1114.5]
MRGSGAGGAGVATALATAWTTLLCAAVWSLLALTHPGLGGVSENHFFDGVWIAVGLIFTLAGLFLVANRNGQALGVLLLVAGLLQSLRILVLLTAALAGAGAEVVDVIAALALAAEITNGFVVVGFPLWLPEARLPGGVWRCLTVPVAAWSAVLAFADTAQVPEWYGLPNPLHRTAPYLWLDGRLGPYLFDLFAASLVLTMTVAVVRWWRLPGPHPYLRAVIAAYLVWAALAAVPHYVAGFSVWLPYTVIVTGEAAWMLLPIAAFRRDRQLFLDRVTRRHLAAFAFCVLLFVGLLLAAYLMRRLLPGTGSGARWWWQLVGAVLLGALLRPAARGVGRAVDRYYYGERAHPYQLVRQLAERMSHAVNPADAPPLLCRTVVQALGLPAAAVRVRTRGGPRELARLGTLDPPGERFPLTYEGAEIGELLVLPRLGQPELDRQDRAVLSLLADQASPAIASLGLYEDLQASREQLVLAREEERRRLRHDLHDGLGPALSGLRLRIDAAGAELPEDSKATASLTAASAGIGQAITELRRITDGLAPGPLDGKGLADALRRLADTLASRSLRVTLDLRPDPLPVLPAAVEVAVYRISGEALNNVVRHSGATRARLSLHALPDRVTVEVADNGRGFPGHGSTRGVGLRSMAERAEELGGTFTADNAPVGAVGAVVRADFPRSRAD